MPYNNLENAMKYLMVLIFVLLAPIVYANNTGAWFDPDQDGHGITLYQWEDNQVFWWFAHTDDNQLWLMSSVEQTEDFILYIPTASNALFPTGNVTVGEPVGTATLVEAADGRLIFTWDILVEEVTCGSKYGLVPPGPLDPQCVGSENQFVPNKVLVEGYDFTGSSRFIRLTPGD